MHFDLSLHIQTLILYTPRFPTQLELATQDTGMLKPHCIRCSHFKVDDISALEASSNRSVCIVEDNVAASLHQRRTP
jgi:hypothetical protein